MTVDSDYTTAISFSTNEKETQTNRTLFARFFPRFEQLLEEHSDWFISLSAPFVIGRRNNEFVIIASGN